MRSTLVPVLTATLFAGALLGSAASAQTGDLSLGVSYSTLYGPTGEIAFAAEDLGPEQDMATTVSYRGGPEGEAGRWSFVRTPEIASGRLTYAASAHVQNWDHIPYESQGARVSVLRDFPLNPHLTVGVGAFAEYDDITAIGSASSVLARDLGSSGSAGLRAESIVTVGDFEPDMPVSRRTRLSSTARLAALGERKYASLELSARHDTPLPQGFAFGARLNGGVIRGLEDSYVSVLNRAFQGEDEPRGFEFGGLGPRDTATGDPLGGTNFYAGSLEVRRALPGAPVVIGAFVDFGSTWSLPGTAGASLEADHSLRASAGISVAISSDIGTLRIAFAEPFAHESHDRLQRVSVALVARF